MSRQWFSSLSAGYTALAATALLAACGAPADDPAKSASTGFAQIVKDREANFKALGRATKAIKEELAGDAPALAKVGTEAAAIKLAAGKIAGFFPVGSGPESGLETDAKAEIWQRGADFTAAHTKLSDAATALEAAAGSGDLAATAAAFGKVGESCKGCHDVFRQKKPD